MIGVLGGYGAVGGHAVRLLAGWGVGPLRIGGRDEVRAKRFAAAHVRGAHAEVRAVDIDDPSSLAEFVRDADVIVNCAGPSWRTTERVTFGALMAGAHLVDSGGGDDLDRIGPAVGSRTALYASGALPGLSGLLPRQMAARHFDAVHALTAYAGVLDRFTTTGADDYLDGVLGGANEPLAVWRGGARRPGALTRTEARTLPHFPRPVTAYPYLDAEGRRLARDLSLTDGTWYTAFDGDHLPSALDEARTLDRAEAVERLCRATALDTAGRTPYVTLLAQLDGTAANTPLTRTAVLRASGIAALTGAMTAVAVLAVVRGEAPPGPHRAAEALDPVTAVERLVVDADACLLTVTDTPLEDLMDVEEGAL